MSKVECRVCVWEEGEILSKSPAVPFALGLCHPIPIIKPAILALQLALYVLCSFSILTTVKPVVRDHVWTHKKQSALYRDGGGQK